MFFTRTESNMRVFLGVLMALIVSGDGAHVTYVDGYVGGSVLLPCICSGRDLDKELKWQMGIEKLVFSTNKDNSSFHPTYKGRTKLFLSENRYNCSVLLTNITADDQGLYKCLYFKEDMYQNPSVNLTISASCPSGVNLSGGNTGCSGLKSTPPPPLENRHKYLKFIPIVLVLALSLLLWHCRTPHNVN